MGRTIEVAESRAQRRLEAVLAEQARLSENYHRAIGTGREHTAYFRLRDANARVAKLDRIARGLGSATRV
jgi:hypothetical protein